MKTLTHPHKQEIHYNGHHTHRLKFKNLFIDTNQELVVFMPRSCHVCKSEGFQALTRLTVSYNSKSIIAALFVTNDGLLQEGEISLSESAARKLEVAENDFLDVSHTEPLHSMSYVRSKLYGNALDQQAFNEIIRDIADEKYSNIFLSSFVASCSGDNMSMEEICFLTKAMVDAGNKMYWGKGVIADKHCIGGLPGNRTSMIVVPIVASLGIAIPKTSSRAITSPAGTADTMEVLTNVNLSLEEMRKVVEKENGCIAWGGAMKLSPADDIIIRVEKALDIDSEGQMIASILSKKIAAGSTHCVIDIPVGPTAKVRSMDSAIQLALRLKDIADFIELKTQVIFSDGLQPVGFGIGPSLEARDVLAVLQNKASAPADLKERAVRIATEIVRLVWNLPEQGAHDLVMEKLNHGTAYKKLISICEAQGGFREPQTAKHSQTIEAEYDGTVSAIDNRKLAMLAKLAGAPDATEAGIDFRVQLKEKVERGQPLFTIYANSPGELQYACDYYRNNSYEIIKILFNE
jgi:thymidine phosphorylase